MQRLLNALLLSTPLLLAGLAGAPAFAQADGLPPADADLDDADLPEAQDDAAPRVVHAAVTELDEGDFRDLDIQGQLHGPGIGFVDEPPPSPGFQFIVLRTGFDAEMRASLAELD